jgi:ATP-dependent RNA helicase RhlE
VFTRTKHGANRLAKQLNQVGISADSIHGDKSQTARTKALARFKNGEVFILVATDIASRGIDVEDITHVFNFDLPNEPEVYIHRIGRTARAGREGLAYAFCDESESGYLVGIERLLGHEIEVLEDQPYHFEKARPKPGQKPGRVKGFSVGGGSRRGTGQGRNMRRYNRGGNKQNGQRNRSDKPSSQGRQQNNRTRRGQRSDQPNRPSGGRPPQPRGNRGKQQGRSNASNRRSPNRSNRRQSRRDDRP